MTKPETINLNCGGRPGGAVRFLNHGFAKRATGADVVLLWQVRVRPQMVAGTHAFSDAAGSECLTAEACPSSR
jgi:hypothetical protein